MNLKFLTDKKNWEKLLFVYRNNKNNAKIEAAYGGIDENIKVYGFYHAYCMCDRWQELVSEQLRHIQHSGLYERLDKLYIGALIKEDDLYILHSIINDYKKIEILYTNCDGSVLEFPTLIELQKKAQHECFYGFYFHTKGITWLSKNPKIYQNLSSWRQMNEYFLFDRWKLAMHSLTVGFDVYGTNYHKIWNDKYRLVGSNFFWFKSEYVARLAKLYIAKDCRNLSEMWICSRTHNVYCPFEFSGNSRNCAIPTEFYTDGGGTRKALLALKIYFVRFMFWFKFLKGFNNQVNTSVNNQRALQDKDFEFLSGHK